MNIIDIQIDWMDTWANSPEIKVVVESLDSVTWEKYPNGLYLGTSDNLIYEHLWHSGKPEQQNGFCGRHFILNMKDGSTTTLKGPWSGNFRDYKDDGCVTEDFITVYLYEKSVKTTGFFGFGIKVADFNKLLDKFLPGIETYIDEHGFWEVKEKGKPGKGQEGYISPNKKD